MDFIIKNVPMDVIARAQQDPQFYRAIKEISDEPTSATMQVWARAGGRGAGGAGRGAGQGQGQGPAPLEGGLQLQGAGSGPVAWRVGLVPEWCCCRLLGPCRVQRASAA